MAYWQRSIPVIKLVIFVTICQCATQGWCVTSYSSYGSVWEPWVPTSNHTLSVEWVYCDITHVCNKHKYDNFFLANIAFLNQKCNVCSWKQWKRHGIRTKQKLSWYLSYAGIIGCYQWYVSDLFTLSSSGRKSLKSGLSQKYPWW